MSQLVVMQNCTEGWEEAYKYEVLNSAWICLIHKTLLIPSLPRDSFVKQNS